MPGPGRPFKKGQSGNPGGKNGVCKEVLDLARSHCKEALDTLVDLMRNSPDEKTRKAASDSILDRGLGRPVQALEHSGADGVALPRVEVRFVGGDE